MKVLCIIPPYIPSYFNAGHHLPVFQVAAYLRRESEINQVDCYDAAAMNITWKDICSILSRQYDLVCVLNDFDGIDTFSRFTYYVKELSPNAKIVTFGRLSNQTPDLFRRYRFDGIVCSGDYEAGVAEYVRYLNGTTTCPRGVSIRENKGYSRPTQGVFLSPEEWGMPDVREIPYQVYESLYIDDTRKFCGIPDRKELVVLAARGCPIGCDFCDVPRMQGLRERRLPVQNLLDYTHTAIEEVGFDYVSFYAPTFTLNRKWIIELCHELIKGPGFLWKCATTLKHLDKELIEYMSEAGCIRISVGVETLGKVAVQNLPAAKRYGRERLIEIATLCNKNGIELNCFVILGLPGDSPVQVRETIDLIESLQARVRPTIYTQFDQIDVTMDPDELFKYNRQIFAMRDGRDPEEVREYYQMFHNNDSRITRVMDKIPRLEVR